MRFMLLLKRGEQPEAGVLQDERLGSALGAYSDEMARVGVLIAAEGLYPSAQGARLHLDHGQFVLDDGPFAEPQGALVAFWVIRVRSKEEALGWAERCPLEAAVSLHARDGGAEVEVRPIVEPDGLPVAADPAGWREREAAFRAGGQEIQADEAVGGGSGGAAADDKLRYMMNFMADADSEAGGLPSERLLAEMGRLMADLARTGVLLAGEGLQASAQGARVKFSAGKRSVIDGPFAETKELIAGYALIRADSKTEAVAVARRCIAVDAPGRNGASTIEVRQVIPGPTASRSLIALGDERDGLHP